MPGLWCKRVEYFLFNLKNGSFLKHLSVKLSHSDKNGIYSRLEIGLLIFMEILF